MIQLCIADETGRVGQSVLWRSASGWLWPRIRQSFYCSFGAGSHPRSLPKRNQAGQI